MCMYEGEWQRNGGISAGVVQTELQTSVEGLMRVEGEDALRGHRDCDSIGMLSLYQL